MGRCGKTVKESALTSLLEYELLAEGHVKKEQEMWERMRWSVFMDWMVNPNLKRRPRQPQDIIRFPWEKEEESSVKDAEPLTEQEIQSLCDIFKINRENIINGQD